MARTASSSGQVGDSSGTEMLKEKTQEAAGELKAKAQTVGSSASDRLRGEIDARSTQAGDQTVSLAGAMRRAGDELRGEGKETPASFADQAAERIESLGEYLRRANADRMLSDVEDFARRRPWSIAAGGFAIGLIASRLLKASSSRRFEGDRRPYGAQDTEYPYSGEPGTTFGPPDQPALSAPLSRSQDW
jgi:ElaB/YqjD/DUF883 family membrane-anchored ribosome-binding protein